MTPEEQAVADAQEALNVATAALVSANAETIPSEPPVVMATPIKTVPLQEDIDKVHTWVDSAFAQYGSTPINFTVKTIEEVKNEIRSAKSLPFRSFLGDILKRLTSRKLWIAIVSAAYFEIHGDPTQSMAVIMAYLGVQGYLDGKSS